MLLCVEYDKLMAAGGTGDYFFIRFVSLILNLLLMSIALRNNALHTQRTKIYM